MNLSSKFEVKKNHTIEDQCPKCGYSGLHNKVVPMNKTTTVIYYHCAVCKYEWEATYTNRS